MKLLGLVAICLAAALSSACGHPSGCRTPSRGSGLSAEVCLAEASFTMGAQPLARPEGTKGTSAPMPKNDWVPAHGVHVSRFFLDAYEVTWSRYRACADAGFCGTDGISRYPATAALLRDPTAANRPVWGVTWNEALRFCAWKGKRLPTEAEWERASRGSEGRQYPWGNEPPPPSLLSERTFYGPSSTDPSKLPPAAGSQPKDVTPDGVHDLFGGVDEWVADWYDTGYVRFAGKSDPQGPPAPVLVEEQQPGLGWVNAHGGKVVRGRRWNSSGGTAWNIEQLGAPAWLREERSPDGSAGFRCARDDRFPGERPRGGVARVQGVSWRWLRGSNPLDGGFP